MNIHDAINILKPDASDLNALKAAYRIKAKEYHPDINPDGLEIMKCINAAYEFLKQNIGKWEPREPAQDIAIDVALAEKLSKVRHFAGIKTEICGTWLWVTGETWRYKSQLKESGFFFAPKKRAWYFHPGKYKRTHKRDYDLDDIRYRYGSRAFDNDPLEALGG